MRSIIVTLSLSLAPCLAVQAVAQSSQADEQDTVQLTLPLVYRGDVLGNVITTVSPKGTAEFDRESLIRQLQPLIAPEAQPQFRKQLETGSMVSPVELQRQGVRLRYDPSRLEIVVEEIDPSIGAVQPIGTYRTQPEQESTLSPAGFSAYLNTIGEMRYNERTEDTSPSAIFRGAARYNGFVFDFDGGYEGTFGDVGLYRRYARLIYDQPEKERRFSVGDLQQNSLSLLGSVFVGGAGIQKGGQVFNSGNQYFSTGRQQVTIRQRTTVEVVSGGVTIDTIELSPGNYDLSQLPLRYASNDIQLFVTEGGSRQRLQGIDLFFDPSSLKKGEVEYGAVAGYPAQNLAFNPEYKEDLAFSGYYRRGVTNRLVLGGALQASEDRQVVAGEARFTPASGIGRLEGSLAASSGDMSGYAAEAAYFFSSSNQDWPARFSLSGFYESENFATIGETINSGFESLTINAAYTQPLDNRTNFTAGATFLERDQAASQRSVFADLTRYFVNGFRGTIGVEYGTGGIYDEELGIRIGFSKRFGMRHSADARYNSRRQEATASFSKSYSEKVGAYGYDLSVRESRDTSSADATFDYIGNRFEARAAYISSGDDFGAIGDNNIARLQVGSSVAFADGNFAIGRPVSDSFVIAKPHESLKDEQVIVGGELRENDYEAASGAFGPALSPRVYSYNSQTIAYDLLNPPRGVDIGTGVETINPPFRSGYVMEVGDEANVSAVGTLMLNGEPGELLVGRVESDMDEEFETQPFFTNSVGRFAVIGLRPGYSYKITLRDDPVEFTITTPEDDEKLVSLGELQFDVPEKEGN